MSQERLCDLSILCAENDKLRLIDFDETQCHGKATPYPRGGGPDHS